jgi:uncharacterized protein (DUF885 family)
VSRDRHAYEAEVDAALDAMLAADPVIATLQGEHRFDGQWPDLSADAERRIAASFIDHAGKLRALAKEWSGADHDTDRPGLDARLLADRLDALRVFKEVVQPTVKDPSAVLVSISTGLDRILAHPYAPLRVRMAAIASRLGAVPALLATARSRLDHPRIAGCELEPVVAQGLVAMMDSEILHPRPEALDGDSALADLVRANAEAAKTAIADYDKTVATLLPSASEQPIGAEGWGRIAALLEGVTRSPADVKKLGEDELARLDRELDQLIASSGKPGESRAAFMARMAEDQPTPDSVLDEYKVSVSRVEAWLHTGTFATVPWEQVQLDVGLSPPHARGYSLASINQSGVLDATTDARFEVNAPTPEMPEPMRKGLLAFHARGTMDLVSAHEGIPGHYLQMLWLRRQPSKVRKLIIAWTSMEGWAHYCEQAILDAGYAGDPQPERARAFAIKMALHRAVRIIADVGESDGSLSLDAATKRFTDDAFLSPAAARIEARRAMIRPVNAFSYGYGKLEILELRRKVQAAEGASFSLQRFHDRLLSFGGIPIPDVARVVFGVELSNGAARSGS